MTDLTYVPPSRVRITGGQWLTAQQRVRQTLLELSVDRLLAPYRREAGDPHPGGSYGGWESLGLDGHTAGHVLSALSWLAASGDGDHEVGAQLDALVEGLAEAQRRGGTGYLGGIPNGAALWRAFVADPHADTLRREGSWVPWYNLHKLYAGLLDAAELAGSHRAFEVLLRLDDWWQATAAQLDEAGFQELLQIEIGGMPDAYARLYERTGDARHLAMAQRFVRRSLFEPLAAGRDELTGVHANTQIPEVIGFARLARLTGERSYAHAAEYFWERVALRTVSIGGHGVREHFCPVGDVTAITEDREGPESCNSYNMAKLAALLFEASGQRRYLDAIERITQSHLLSWQHPEHGGFVYFTPMRPAHYRRYSSAEDSFWCCQGTGMEAQAQYASRLYAATAEGALAVVGFADSTYADRAITLTQTVTDDGVRLTIARTGEGAGAAQPVRVRVPVWAEGVHVHADGAWAHEGDWLVIDVDVTDVRVGFDRSVRLEMLPGTVADDGTAGADTGWGSLVYGPTVLALRAGPAPEPTRAPAGRVAHIARGPLVPLAQTPVLAPDVAAHATPNAHPSRETALFSVPSSEGELTLEPFSHIHDDRYTIYFPIAASDEVAAVRAKLAERDAVAHGLDSRTIDVVELGAQQPETDHALRGEPTEALESGAVAGVRWRGARGAGAAFELVLRDWLRSAADLMITTLDAAVTGTGGDAGRDAGRDAEPVGYRVVVDGEVVLDTGVTAAVDTVGAVRQAALTRTDASDEEVRVRIEVAPGAAWTGPIAELRLLSAASPAE